MLILDDPRLPVPKRREVLLHLSREEKYLQKIRESTRLEGSFGDVYPGFPFPFASLRGRVHPGLFSAAPTALGG
jgi:hypothetical protein